MGVGGETEGRKDWEVRREVKLGLEYKNKQQG